MAGSERLFLNVEKSVSGRPWVDRLNEEGARIAAAMSQQFGVSEIVTRVLAARGVALEETEDFLNPTIRHLMPDPATLTAMDALTERLADAIARGERIGLFGDYDVDGAASCALMTRFLRAFGIEPDIHIPDRIYEGYGPNVGAMDKLIDGGASLIITLDCGTTSEEPIAHAKSRGADVLVIDHHLTDADLPVADAIVNPNRPDDISGLGHLCAAGVTFMVLVSVNRALREKGHAANAPNLMNLVDLVALATVCDVVPLTGLNRAFVVRGVEIMRKGANRGIAALALAARLSGPIAPYHLGYLIGPRINAGGRIGDAALGARLLSSDDEHECLHIAGQLNELNVERQRIEKQAVDEAAATADAEIGEGEGPPLIVVASPEWHQGVVGLVAARLKERFGRPAFAIAQAASGGGTGSGRSVPGVDLGRAVLAAVEAGIITKGGGHAMAAGITLSPGQLGEFRSFMTEALADDIAEARRADKVKIDAALTARGATTDFIHEVERAGPFGSGNPSPVFALPHHRITFADIVGEGGHVRATLAAGDGARLNAIAFRAAGTPLGDALMEGRDAGPIHLCGGLSINHWQGQASAQLRIIDAAYPG